MTFSNPWLWIALISTIGLWKLELLATFLNMSALSPKVPKRLEGTVTEEEHERALEYARISARFGVLSDSIQLAVFLGFWFIGGFDWVDHWVRGFGLGEIQSGLVLLSILFVAQGLLSLPFDWYDTFRIEAEFGFNKTTLGTFIMDRVKGLCLAAILGLPLLAVLLHLFASYPLAALYAWLIVTAFSLVLSFLSPRLILPLFFKFQPLEDAELKAAIMELSRKLDFPVGEVSVVDGSKRSTKANAFFTGFGSAKRIALFDTLMKNHSREEILAVLAHEIGHCKRRHVPKQLALSILSTGLMFALMHFAIHDPRLCAAFGVMQPSVACGFAFFGILFQPVSTLIGLLGSWLSRKFEFEADAYAKEAMASPKPLVDALTRLTRDHLGNPTPHPFYVTLHYSHPPILQRLQALEA
ncbi:M48 family metallopeptidase [Roseimicrobium sp. ORNL1]|uniref:M48 family metallopeptidase n=1 Tax=Roseimicrobium sp. ORNL1 TaxID=2711231 RepID=UPI0013E1CEB7|nr:M48 family metallopeptidase [Roseimicrobium sp. ORNL1]QIF03670.1 M48 family metallopeptidase [Roseimicrobium sp. ORNL1]